MTSLTLTPRERLTPERRATLGRRAQLLALASVVYNLLEAVVALAAGTLSGSVALVAFGLDSLIEVSSGVIVLWQFRAPVPEERERLALRMMAVGFFALAAYVGVESVRHLLGDGEAGTSTVGIVLAAVFCVLGVLPLIVLTQVGIIVGLGILLDTFLVRTVIIPALFTLIGPRIWWPALRPGR